MDTGIQYADIAGTVAALGSVIASVIAAAVRGELKKLNGRVEDLENDVDGVLEREGGTVRRTRKRRRG